MENAIIETVNGDYEVFVCESSGDWKFSPSDYNGGAGFYSEEFFPNQEAATEAAKQDAERVVDERNAYEYDQDEEAYA